MMLGHFSDGMGSWGIEAAFYNPNHGNNRAAKCVVKTQLRTMML